MFTKKIVNDNVKKNMYVLLVIIIIAVVASNVSSDPPEQKNVYGKVYLSAGVGAPNGLNVSVNNTNILQMFYTQVFAPPIPQLAGAYSLVVNGSTGNTVIIRSFNATHHGQTTVVLGASGTVADITLNLSRPPEANITILAPVNNTLVNISNTIEIAVNMSVLISNGVSCNITLSIENESVLNYSAGTNITNVLGGINIGQYKNTSFELTAIKSGNTNVFVEGMCEGGEVSYLGLHTDTLSNITVEDSESPIVNLVSPQNISQVNDSNQILFVYNVSDNSVIENCSLYIDGSMNVTNYSITKDVDQNFSVFLDNGVYNWSVVCFDDQDNSNLGNEFIVDVFVHAPVISFLTSIPTVTLVAGGTKLIECNASVEDRNGAGDIAYLNATLYSLTSQSSAVDNNNDHYTNSSCSSAESFGNITNYTCTFDVYYYALNGTWECNATTQDNQNLISSNETNLTIDTLYALNVSKLLIDYGQVASSSLSSDQTLNITNFGNRPLNISVFGYGGDNPVTGLGYSFFCSGGGNITVSNERYSFNPFTNFELKNLLTSSAQDMGGTLNKQTVPGIPQINTTYWQMNASTSDIGQCNGTIRLTASAS